MNNVDYINLIARVADAFLYYNFKPKHVQIYICNLIKHIVTSTRMHLYLYFDEIKRI